jgi:hypothetical protein
MNTTVFRSVLIAGVLLAGLPVAAHHAIQAQYDFKKPVELQGTISKVMWTNPHGYIYVDVPDAQGKVTTWELQLGGPAALRNAGLGRRSRNGIEIGEKVKFIGFQGHNGSPIAWLTKLVLADGREVTVWFGDPQGR